MVGQVMLRVLEERNFPIDELIPVASARSVGTPVWFKGKEYKVVGMETALDMKPHLALFSAGGDTSKEWAPKFAEVGTIVIDNSSAWRMNPKHKLIVPEINAGLLRIDDRIIANPNCSTIQMVMALAPLHVQYGLQRLVISTYQSVTGTGKNAVDQMNAERKGEPGNGTYPYQIDLNVLPHIDVFQENGYTKEEMKMVHETRKILQIPDLAITATAVRIPVIGGHSESINLELQKDFDLEEVRKILNDTPGVVVQDDVENLVYPMPLDAHGKDEVFVGRIRRDESQPRTLNMWVVSDNLRKGAATNAVQIAEYMVEHYLVY